MIMELYESYEKQFGELPLDNKGNFFENFFAFEGRVRRRDFCLVLLAYFLCETMLSMLTYDTYMGSYNPLKGILSFILYFILIMIGCKRCHDFGVSGWYQLIPFFVIILCFADGIHGINEYGSNPKEDYDPQLIEYMEKLKANEEKLLQ